MSEVMIRGEQTMTDESERQEAISKAAEFLSKDLLHIWRFIDKMLPEQLGPIRDGLKRRYGKSDDGTGLTTNFMMFLCIAGVLYRDGIMTMGQLSRATSIPQATVTRMVRWMVDSGYVVRIQDTQDKRITNIRLTDSGLELLLAAKEQLKEFAIMLLEGLPTMQRMVFILSISDIISAWRTVQARQNGATHHSK